MQHKKRFAFSKKTIIVASVIIAVALVWIIIAIATSVHHNSNSSKSNKSGETPQFSTVLPSSKSVDDLGGWTRISPPNNDPVYAYNDTIGSVPINVSEQPLPTSFKTNTDAQIAELAKKFSATDSFTAGSTKVYVGTSSKGPQSVILTKNDLLILIKSQQKVQDDDWKKYIQSLN